LPLVAGYFNQISLIGLFANFIMVPLVGFLAIPIGLVALFVSPLSATAALWCIHLDVAILTIALESVQFLADLPFAAVKTFTPSLFEIGCFYALCWALLNMRRQPPAATSKSPIDPVVPTVPDPGNLKISLSDRDSSPGRFQGVFRRLDIKALSRIRPAIAVLTLVLVALSADTGYWLYQRYGSPDLRITIIDVGHGSSSLLEFPGGYTLLIDGGGFTDNSAFDVGAAIVAPLLWRKKIRTVDALILSHPNSDHLNGLIFIARHFHVKKVWTNRETRKTLGYQSFMEVIANKKIVWPSFEDMQRNVSINGVKLDFLYPPRDFLARIGKEKWRNTNNNSLVVKVSIGSNSFLFPGDIMAAAEKELVDLAGEKLISTVLIAPHHGSRSSSSTDFLSKVNPKVVVISCGRQNRFKLPDPAILEKYQHRGYAVYRTDINGAIFMATDGQHLDVKPFVQF
jgi:competence protein ComEC